MTEKIRNLKLKNYLIIAGIVIAAVVLFSYVQKSFVTIEVVPKVATVSIDSQKVKLNRSGIVRRVVKPGKHIVSIEAEGYVGQSKTYTFRGGILNSVKATLKELPEPIKISTGSFLAKSDENTLFFLSQSDSRLYKSQIKANDAGSTDITTFPVTEKVISGASEIIWSPNFDLALFRKADGIYLFDFKKYDFVNQTETLWGTDIGSIAWAPDNTEVAYFYAPPTGEKLLIFADVTNTSKTVMLNLKDIDVSDPLLRWSPDSETLLLISRNQDVSLNKIYSFKPSNKELKILVDIGSQTDALFSPDSSKILYATYSKETGNPINTVISSMKADGTEQKNLDLRTNLLKIAWIDQDAFLTTVYDSATAKYQMIHYSLSSGREINILPKGEVGSIKSVLSMEKGKIVVFQGNSDIYGIRVD